MIWPKGTYVYAKLNNIYGVECALITGYNKKMNCYSIDIKSLGMKEFIHHELLHCNFVHELFYIKNKNDLYLPSWF